jgi:hypothetical protein
MFQFVVTAFFAHYVHFFHGGDTLRGGLRAAVFHVFGVPGLASKRSP